MNLNRCKYHQLFGRIPSVRMAIWLQYSPVSKSVKDVGILDLGRNNVPKKIVSTFVVFVVMLLPSMIQHLWISNIRIYVIFRKVICIHVFWKGKIEKINGTQWEPNPSTSTCCFVMLKYLPVWEQLLTDKQTMTKIYCIKPSYTVFLVILIKHLYSSLSCCHGDIYLY